MASPPVLEWVGLQQFPAATKIKLIELLGKLKQENVDRLTILVMGKGGVGKSSTINSLMGEQVFRVSSFQSEGLRPMMGGYINYQAIELIKGFLLNKTIDVLLFVDRLDAYRVHELDKQIIRAITDAFGKKIWCRSLLVLTHAQLCLPDGLSYSDFFSKRSKALLQAVGLGARIGKNDFEHFAIPVFLVENSGRCNKNGEDEKILPNGDVWIPNLVKAITSVTTSRSQAVVVDKKLIDGPNNKGKTWIPLILGVQWLVVKWIQGAIKSDIASGTTLFRATRKSQLPV
ncbi:hypothetical protein SLA2020_087880 [Shorea laevis]